MKNLIILCTLALYSPMLLANGFITDEWVTAERNKQQAVYNQRQAWLDAEIARIDTNTVMQQQTISRRHKAAIQRIWYTN